MKTDKPTTLHIDARLTMGGAGGFISPVVSLLSACKQLDKVDYVTLDGFYCYPVKTLAAILSTYAKDSTVVINPVTGWTRYDSAHNWLSADDAIPVYNVLALRERVGRHPVESTQKIYPVRCDSITSDYKTAKSVICTLTSDDITDSQPIDPWIGKAASKDDPRPALMAHGGNFASDGFRLHYNAALPALPYESLRESALKDILSPAKKYNNTITLNAAAARELITACKLAKKEHRILRMSVNGSLELTTTSEEFGEYHQTITDGYTHSGPDVTLAINPQYIMEAIDKPHPVKIVIRDGNSPVYVTDGEREAVIMTMRINA